MTKRFSASSAAQLMQCHGSANLELAIPGYKEPVRDEMAGAKGVGTRMHDSFRPLAHWNCADLDGLAGVMKLYASEHWRKRRTYMDDITSLETLEWVWDTFPGMTDAEANKYLEWIWELDGEERLPPLMLDYVVNTIKELSNLIARLLPRTSEIRAEWSISCDWLQSAPLTTPDIVFATEKELVVVDYKTGRIPVSPVDNFQLMFYAYSAYARYYAGRRVPRDFKVTMVIWQPRNHDAWETTLDHVRDWALLAAEADGQIIRKDLTLRPGSACTFCPANPHSRGDKAPPYCPAMMAKLYPDTTDEEGILDL